MKVALVPLNPRVGDVAGNLDKILKFCDQAIENNCLLIVFPELSLIGYPPKDLLHLQMLFEKQNEALNTLRRKSKKITIIVGGYSKNKNQGAPFHNSAFVFHNGQKEVYHKRLLPNYDVFDEKRYFESGHDVLILKMGSTKFGISICEDIWSYDEKVGKRYEKNILDDYEKPKIDYLINLSASPFEIGKSETRKQLFKHIVKKTNSTLVYVNQLGANDDLIFDGRCLAMSADEKLLLRSQGFSEDLIIFDTDSNAHENRIFSEWDDLEQALCLGIKDYFHKTGFKKAILGLSGGIDSALVAQLAVKALGKDNVLGVLMPSRYSSKSSVTDSKELATNLGIETLTLEIDNLHKSYEKTFRKIFGKSGTKDLTDQNIQARIRGNLLMALTNNDNSLLLNTTNKSELAMGYGTLYGDMCGALGVISDLTKEMVYALAKAMNPGYEFIPRNIFDKEPSAELKPDQKDSDNLPRYEKLDPWIEDWIENEKVEEFLDNETHIFQQMMRNEYKRNQAALGLKVTSKAFGSGRRYPIVMKL